MSFIDELEIRTLLDERTSEAETASRNLPEKLFQFALDFCKEIVYNKEKT